jgi:hypothetical protein
LVVWLARKPRLMRVALIDNSVRMTLVAHVVGLDHPRLLSAAGLVNMGSK